MALEHAHSVVTEPGFGSGTPYTVGVEEELFLVDPLRHQPSHVTDEVLAPSRRFSRGEVVGEISEGVVELCSPVCADAGEAVRRLRGLRAAVLASRSAALLGAGLHPTAPFGSAELRSDEHYRAVEQDTRGLLRRGVSCGVHVHVGMPDAETAIAAFNGMRKW